MSEGAAQEDPSRARGGRARRAAALLLAAAVLAAGVLVPWPQRDRGPADGSGVACGEGEAWGEGYSREYQALQEGVGRWQPYVLWKAPQFDGEFFHIDASGIRRTWRDGRADRARRVLFLGGSTMFGLGARDDYTIPSIVARDLAAAGVPIDATNLGVPGWVSTQEVIDLALRLRQGDVPDAVVLYDGVNDSGSACQTGSPGHPLNESNRELEFNLAKRPGDMLRLAAAGILKRSIGAALVDRLAAMLGAGGNAQDPCGPAADAALAAAVARTWVGNLRLVQSMARDYGFEVLAYWQPTAGQKRTRTPYEDARLNEYAGFGRFFAATSQAVRVEAARAGLPAGDLEDALSTTDACVFLDGIHANELGNGLIAGRIARDLIPLLSAKRAAGSPAPQDGSAPGS